MPWEVSFQELALESPDAAERRYQTSQWFSLPRLSGQGQSASLQCSVPLDQLLAQLAEGLLCSPTCYFSLISSKPLALISTLNDLINLYNSEMMSSLNIGTGPLGNQLYDECHFCPLNRHLSHWLPAGSPQSLYLSHELLYSLLRMEACSLKYVPT